MVDIGYCGLDDFPTNTLDSFYASNVLIVCVLHVQFCTPLVCRHIFCPLDPSDPLTELYRQVSNLDPCLLITSTALLPLSNRLPLSNTHVLYLENVLKETLHVLQTVDYVAKAINYD